MDQSLRTVLITIGFTEKQATLYLSLLALGEAPAGKIAEHSHLNRTVVYEILKDLQQMGYVTEQTRTKVKRYRAADPKKILQSLRANVENFSFMIPLFQALHRRGDTKPHVEFHEGREAITKIFQGFDQAISRRFMSSFAHVKRVFPEELKRWQDRTMQVKTPSPTKYLLAFDQVSQSFADSLRKRIHQEFRFFPQAKDFSMDVAIVDDVLAITSFDPVYSIVISSPALARSAALLFDLAWKSAKK